MCFGIKLENVNARCYYLVADMQLIFQSGNFHYLDLHFNNDSDKCIKYLVYNAYLSRLQCVVFNVAKIYKAYKVEYNFLYKSQAINGPMMTSFAYK